MCPHYFVLANTPNSHANRVTKGQGLGKPRPKVVVSGALPNGSGAFPGAGPKSYRLDFLKVGKCALLQRPRLENGKIPACKKPREKG